MHEKGPHNFYCTKKALPPILTSFFLPFRLSNNIVAHLCWATISSFMIFLPILYPLSPSLSTPFLAQPTTHNTSIPSPQSILCGHRCPESICYVPISPSRPNPPLPIRYAKVACRDYPCPTCKSTGSLPPSSLFSLQTNVLRTSHQRLLLRPVLSF